MAMSLTVTTINGQIVHENRAGVERFYVPDPLGNTVALVDTTGAVTDTWTYWPYGELQNHAGTSTTSFTFGGILGYFQGILNMFYVRARYLRADLTRWITRDSLWPNELPYSYAYSTPSLYSDPFGLGLGKCERCAAQLDVILGMSQMHDCCHCYVHCLACCVLNHEFDAGCAREAQAIDNWLSTTLQGKNGGMNEYRNKYCELGISGNVATADCGDHCASSCKPPCENTGASCHPPVTKPTWPLGSHLPPDCYNASPFIRWGICGPGGFGN
jgi:RHS repeat-associated protein